MNIVIVGSGYVGLVTGACLSEFGFSVTCIDKAQEKIAALGRGEMPIYEPGLDDLVARNVSAGRLRFATDLDPHVAGANIVFIAVGTPARRGDGYADLDYVFAAADEIARRLHGFTVIATKSTVPVGTGHRVRDVIARANPAADFEVVSNPEFLREGAAINDFMRPDRIIVGAESERAREVMKMLYRPLYLLETPVLFTSLETAELIKYASNAFLAVKISFINQVADLCEELGADVHDVARGMGLDRRIGPKFLHPGPGFGGSCFPKDLLALSRTAHDAGSAMSIVDEVIAYNDRRKQAMADRIVAAMGGSVAGRTVAVLGLAFKPETDDVRESPALVILPALAAAGATVRAYDPAAVETARTVLGEGTVYCASTLEALAGADAMVVVTEWNEFRALDLDQAKDRMAGNVLVDLRNVYSPAEAAQAGFDYHGIGRQRASGRAAQ